MLGENEFPALMERSRNFFPSSANFAFFSSFIATVKGDKLCVSYIDFSATHIFFKKTSFFEILIEIYQLTYVTYTAADRASQATKKDTVVTDPETKLKTEACYASAFNAKTIAPHVL